MFVNWNRSTLWYLQTFVIPKSASSIDLAHCESGSLMFKFVVCEYVFVICTVGLKSACFLLKS